jgi:hypothetical protein
MNSYSNVIPFVRPAPKQRPPTSIQSEAERRRAILGSAEATDLMQLAQYLADKTNLSAQDAVASLAVCVRSSAKAQADTLTAAVAKRKLQQRCIDILTSPPASEDIDLAVWLVRETDASSAVAIEVMNRTHESALCSQSTGNDQ